MTHNYSLTLLFAALILPNSVFAKPELTTARIWFSGRDPFTVSVEDFSGTGQDAQMEVPSDSLGGPTGWFKDHFPYLRRLSLRISEFANAEEKIKILKDLKKEERLVELNLDMSLLDKGDAQALVEGLGLNLHILRIENIVRDAQVEVIQGLMKHLKTLNISVLSFKGCGLDVQSLRIIEGALPSLPQLQSIDLSDNFVRNFQRFPGIAEVDFIGADMYELRLDPEADAGLKRMQAKYPGKVYYDMRQLAEVLEHDLLMRQQAFRVERENANRERDERLRNRENYGRGPRSYDSYGSENGTYGSKGRDYDSYGSGDGRSSFERKHHFYSPR